MSEQDTDEHEAPAWLSECGKDKWGELIAAYPQTAGMPDQLAMLCEAWSTYLSAVRDIQAMGIVIRAGERVWNNPAIATKEQERKSIIKISKILGLIKDEADDEVPSPLRAIVENR